jgi:hypothetical protein
VPSSKTHRLWSVGDPRSEGAGNGYDKVPLCRKLGNHDQNTYRLHSPYKEILFFFFFSMPEFDNTPRTLGETRVLVTYRDDEKLQQDIASIRETSASLIDFLQVHKTDRQETIE